MIDPLVVGWVGLIILFAIIALGLPIGIAMALVGFAGYAAIAGLPAALTQLQNVPYSSVASYSLTIIPLFILMGEFAFFSGIIRGAYNAMYKWLGHLPGGVAMSTIGGCAAFAAVCGSSIATASSMSTIAYPEMKRFGYDDKLATGSIASGGTLGILIPPSNPLVIYALFAQVSVGKLLISGVIPGVLLAVLFMLAIYIWTKINPAVGPAGPFTPWKEKFKSLTELWPVLILAIVVLGSIWGGVMTAMEAAGVGAFLAFIIGLALRKINLKNIISSLNMTIKTSGMIFIVLIGAMIFNYFIVMSGIPQSLASIVTNASLSPMTVLACILVIYLILGCLMDVMAMTVLTLPIFVPVLSGLGFNLVWFGIVFVIMGEMALITPPIGMNVFVISGMIKEVPMYTVFKGVWPFLIAMVVCLALVIAFPQIALFLSNLMIK
jgi:C4-dicarboxylate transporter DctM subunit